MRQTTMNRRKESRVTPRLCSGHEITCVDGSAGSSGWVPVYWPVATRARQVTFSILARAIQVSNGIDGQPLPILCWSRRICAYNNTHSAEVEEVAGVVPFARQISHRLAPIGGHNGTAITQVIGATVALAGFNGRRADVANGTGQGRRRQEPVLGVQGEGVDAGAIEFDLGGTVGLDESVSCRGPDGQEEQRDGDARHHVGLS